MAAQTEPVSSIWLRGASFDLHFIVGIAALALLSGWAVVLEPRLFVPILLTDLWLLGYHHVVATYTRLCFDRESLDTHRFLLFGLPPIVLAAVCILAFSVGVWVLATVYLYWQWYHYTRQSWGISQVYRRKSGGLANENHHLSIAVFYLLPLWGILRRSHQDPGTFLGLELRVLPVPEIAVSVIGIAALLTLGWWIGMRVMAWYHGRLPLVHTLYMMSHFTVFYVAYIVIDHIDYGWLVVNIWHNAQYIVFVWLFNNNRFKSGTNPKAKFLSIISQDQNAWRYFAVCIGLSTVIYLTISNMTAALLPLVIVIYQTINFHHYIVDGVIWKIRRKPLQQVLGITT